MRILPITNYNLKRYNSSSKQAFGHIYSNAVDALRHSSEGYSIQYTYDSSDLEHKHPFKHEYYEIFEDKDNKMTRNQVKRLQDLVLRASKLKKSIVYGLNYEPFIPFSDELSLVVMEGKERNLATHPDDIDYKMVKGDKEGNLDKFQKIVEWAEQIEKTDAPEIQALSKESKQELDRNRVEKRYKKIYQKTYLAPKKMY